MKKNANTTPKTRNSTIEIVRKIVLFLGPQNFTSLMTYLHQEQLGPFMYLLSFQCIYYYICGTLNREQECLNHLGDRTTI